MKREKIYLHPVMNKIGSIPSVVLPSEQSLGLFTRTKTNTWYAF